MLFGVDSRNTHCDWSPSRYTTPLPLKHMESAYKGLVAFYDAHVGTPCEEMRHKEQVDQLTAELAKVTAERDAAYEQASSAMSSVDEARAERDRLKADVARLTSWVNTTIKGANSGHLDGETPHA